MIVFVFLGFNIPASRLVNRSQARAANGRPLRVLSYNVFLSNLNVTKIAETIQQQNADIICLQEAPLYGQPESAKFLLTLMEGWHAARSGELITLSRYKIKSSQTFRTRDTQMTGIQKTVIDVEGRPVEVFNMHLPVPTTKANAKVHTESALPRRARLLQLLIEKAGNHKTPVIIAGDFNVPPRGPFYSELRLHWNDAFRETGWGTGHTWVAGMGLMRIDYIWTNPKVRVRSCHVIQSNASDHFPLLAELNLL